MLQVLLRLCGFSAFVALVAVVVFMACGFCGSWLLRALGLFWFLGFCGFLAFVFVFPSLSLCACLREELTDVFNRNLLYNYFYLICVSQQITGEKRGWLLHMNLHETIGSFLKVYYVFKTA